MIYRHTNFRRGILHGYFSSIVEVSTSEKKVFLTEAAQTSATTMLVEAWLKRLMRVLTLWKGCENIANEGHSQYHVIFATFPKALMPRKKNLTEAAQTSATTMLVEALTSSAPIVSAQVEPLAIQTATEYLGQKHLCLHVFL